MTRFITILSGKGGVGKTTLALSLGAALKRFGRDVTILDANLDNADIGLHLGVSSFPSDLTHFIKGEKEIADVIYLHPAGFKVIPSGIDNSRIKHFDVDYKRIFEKLQGLSEIVIIDCPPGLGKDVESLLSMSDECLVIANPDIISATNALKAIKLAEEKNSTVLGVVLNRTKNSIHEMNTESMEEFLGIPIIADVPEDEAVVKSRVEKSSLIFDHPEAEASINIKKLAAKLIGDNYEAPLKRGWF
jgi:septum site-determining protein MinD